MTYTITVCVDWDNNGDYTTAGDDITALVIDAGLSRGFSGEMRHTADVGQAFFKLDNGDKRFSPEYAAGPLYGKLLPNRPVRVQATSGVTTWTLWTGVTREYAPAPGSGASKFAILTCEDSLTKYQMETIDLPIQERITAGRLCDLITNSVFRGTAAALTAVFHGQILNGDTILLGGSDHQFERTYKFVSALTPASNEILIGATKEATAQNWADAINGNTATVGTAFAATTTRNELFSAGDAAAGTVNAGGTTTIAASGATSEIGNVSGNHKELMQVVDLSGPGLLSQFKITLDANTGTPSGTITYYLFDGPLASSYPAHVDVKGQARITGTFTPTASAENTINIGTPQYFGAKVGIWLSATTPQSTDNYWTWKRSTTDIHGSASAKLYSTFNAGHNWTSANVDAACAVTTSATTDSNIVLTALVRGAEGNSISVYDIGAYFNGGDFTGGADAPAGLISSQTGDRVFELAGEDWSQDTTNAWQALNAVVNAEFGYFWAARDGTLTFKNRFWEFALQVATPAATVNNDATGLSGSLSDRRIANKVSVTYLPKSQQTAGIVAKSFGVIEVPGWSFNLDTTAWGSRTNRGGRTYSGTPSQPAGKPKPGDKIVRLPYTDANGNRIGAKNLLAPVRGTDYQINDQQDGAGFDYTYDQLRFGVALAPGGSDVEVSFKNPASGPIYVLNFQIQGTQIQRYSPETHVYADDTSIGAFGTHPTDYSLDMGSDLVFAEAIGYYILARYANPVYTIDTLSAEGPETLGGVNILALEIGDVLVITETQTGVASQRYVVRGMDYTLAQGGQMVNAQLRLKRLETFNIMILDDAVYGVLDAANCLAL